MVYTFRTSGPWGPGLSADLTPAQVDNNFWQAIQDIQAKAVQGVGIANFVVQGGEMTVVLTDHTLLGPYPLPLATLAFKGTWTPNTYYSANDIVTYGGSTYIVLVNHTSAATFDPGANDGLGNDYYGQLLSNPAASLPTGGTVGEFLRKASTADFVAAWETAMLAHDLADVTIASPVIGDVLTYVGGVWENQPAVRALDDLSDVSVTTPTNGQLLEYEAGVWINVPPAVQPGILIQEVSPVSPGEPLVFNGTAYINSPYCDFPWTNNTDVNGAWTIDRANGEVQTINLAADTTLTFTGWPGGQQFARLVLRVVNPGTAVVTWPIETKWAGGIIPIVSVNATDLYIFFSFDNGATVYGNAVGLNYF